MGLFSGKKNVKCQRNEDSSVDCIAYQSTREGKKIVTATLKGTVDPSTCQISTIDHDGNETDIEMLEEHLGKRARVKCNKNSPSEL